MIDREPADRGFGYDPIFFVPSEGILLPEPTGRRYRPGQGSSSAGGWRYAKSRASGTIVVCRNARTAISTLTR
ncbi:hypothetical protein ACLB1S_25460 [Escherichia coli]